MNISWLYGVLELELIPAYYLKRGDRGFYPSMNENGAISTIPSEYSMWKVPNAHYKGYIRDLCYSDRKQE